MGSAVFFAIRDALKAARTQWKKEGDEEGDVLYMSLSEVVMEEKRSLDGASVDMAVVVSVVVVVVVGGSKSEIESCVFVRWIYASGGYMLYVEVE